ncbi:hypothetical protein GF391_02290 [Candidatus Uhrbacteria bacterium]|nr:hypothetical protein [Candidatus Uhrbacteria bacterium]
MPRLSTPPAPIIRQALSEDQLKNFRQIIKQFGWQIIPFKLFFGPSASADPVATAFNLEWLHTFFEVYADQQEKQYMLKSGYQPRS